MVQKHIGDSNFRFFTIVSVKTLATTEGPVKAKANRIAGIVRSLPCSSM